MQKKFGYAPLGAADGPVKSAIFGGNNARLYDIQPKRAMLELKGDRFAMMKAEYEKAGPSLQAHATAMWCRTGPWIIRYSRNRHCERKQSNPERQAKSGLLRRLRSSQRRRPLSFPDGPKEQTSDVQLHI